MMQKSQPATVLRYAVQTYHTWIQNGPWDAPAPPALLQHGLLWLMLLSIQPHCLAPQTRLQMYAIHRGAMNTPQSARPEYKLRCHRQPAS